MPSHLGPVLAQRDDLTAIDCRECGYAHLWPMPTIGADYYASTFWQETKAGARKIDEARRDWLDMRHDDWLECLRSLTIGRTLLDVGCGYGNFLARAQINDWFCCAIEPSMEAAAACRLFVPIVSDTWESYAYHGQWDAITAFWLLEHLPDPLAFLRWCHAHLYGGGALMLAVPNEWTVEQAAANVVVARKAWWLDPTHMSYFTPASLANLLGRAGFRIVDSLATAQMENFILDGRDYTADSAVGLACHAEVRAREMVQTWDERMAEARHLALQGRGRDRIVVCVKDLA